MTYFRPSSERGNANFGWLDSKHSFSFGHYYDPKHMGVSVLRVINDDTVAPGAGFDTHGHRDMEIISYVLKGAIEHQDSMGNKFVVPAGEVQRMSAGTGITHSEFNHSNDEELKFLQIWIQPKITGLRPSYEQKRIEQSDKLTALVTPDGRQGSVSMHQDAFIYRLCLNSGEHFTLTSERTGYLHIIEGGLLVNGQTLEAGDGLGVGEQSLKVSAKEQGIVALWFDLPHASSI